MANALKALLRARRIYGHGDFVREYGSHASRLKSTAPPPSPATYHRWISGATTKAPRGHHQSVLESMFPGWTIAELFASEEDMAERLQPASSATRADALTPAVARELVTRDVSATGWGPGMMPPTYLDTQSRSSADTTELPASARKIGKRIATLAKELRLDPAEAVQLASLRGNIVDLDHRIDIDVDAEGRIRLVYRHELFNMSDLPVTKIPREQWFKHVHAPIEIEPIRVDHHRISIERGNQAHNLSKFACQISPAIQPGETGIVSYSCTGGRFVDEFYWQQDLFRFTRRLTIRLHQHGPFRMVNCNAEETQLTGATTSVTESLLWDFDEDGIVVTLARDYLRPSQSVTLRWEFDRGDRPA